MSQVSLITLIPTEHNGDWLAKCMESVAENRIPDMKHIMVETKEFYKSRRETYLSGGLVGCVDYDDWLELGVVKICKEALINSKTGISFTWQRGVDENGKEILLQKEPISNQALCSRPNSLHHFALLNSDLLPKYLFSLIEDLGVEIYVDWIVRAYLAFHYGATQVPVIGYNWRQHAGQATKLWDTEYREKINKAKNLLKTWAPTNVNLFKSFPVYSGSLLETGVS